jgi:tetratricopeptide (TPR) repeat protein
MSEKSKDELVKQITLLKDKDENKEALDMINEAIKDYPKDASLWFLKARALNGLNRVEESLVACDKAIEHGYDKPNVVYNYKGTIFQKQGHFEDALKAYDLSLSIDSTSVETLLEKGKLIHLVKGDSTPMLPIANRIIELDPKFPGGWLLKSAAHGLKNENRDAEDAVNKALELDPNFVEALSFKAALLMDAGRKSEARKLIEKATELNPKDKELQDMKKDITLSHIMGDSEDIPTVEEAKKSLTRCWILPAIIGGYSILATIGGFITLISMGMIGTAIGALFVGLVLALISAYAGWSLYWGWGPIWPRWKNFFNGWGFFSNNWILWIIVICLFIELPVLIAIVHGAIYGIRRYKKLKLIVANSS